MTPHHGHVWQALLLQSKSHSCLHLQPRSSWLPHHSRARQSCSRFWRLVRAPGSCCRLLRLLGLVLLCRCSSCVLVGCRCRCMQLCSWCRPEWWQEAASIGTACFLWRLQKPTTTTGNGYCVRTRLDNNINNIYLQASRFFHFQSSRRRVQPSPPFSDCLLYSRRSASEKRSS